jgi:hypothetical protein
LAQNLGAQVDFDRTNATGLDFSAKTRMSGTDLPDGTEVRKGAVDAVKGFVRSRGGNGGPDLDAAYERVSRLGGTPLGVCQGSDTYGIIYLKDVIKPIADYSRRADYVFASERHCQIFCNYSGNICPCWRFKCHGFSQGTIGCFVRFNLQYFDYYSWDYTSIKWCQF